MSIKDTPFTESNSPVLSLNKAAVPTVIVVHFCFHVFARTHGGPCFQYGEPAVQVPHRLLFADDGAGHHRSAAGGNQKDVRRARQQVHH